MRTFLLAMLLPALLAACAGAPAPTPTPTAAPLTRVRLAMGYIPDIQFAPFYVADAKGYFRAQGIDIEFVTMFEDQSVPLLGTNEISFANVSAEQVIQARAQELPVLYVMKWWEKYPIAIVSRAGLSITSPADLAGRKVGIPGLYGASYIGWQALLNAESLPRDLASLEAIGFTQAEAIAAGQVDAAIVYANNEPVKLAAAGEAVNTLYVSDYIELASNGLATNEQTARDNPQLVRGMTAAILQGLKDTLANPEEALQLSLQYIDPAPDPVIARQVLQASIAMWQSEHPGLTDVARWETTQDVLLAMGLIQAPIELDQAFTNEFLK